MNVLFPLTFTFAHILYVVNRIQDKASGSVFFFRGSTNDTEILSSIREKKDSLPTSL